MNLIDDDSKGVPFQLRDDLGHKGELLDCRNNDVLSLLQKVFELLGVQVHGVHHPFGLFQLGDRPLKLFVQNLPVCDDQDGIEHPLFVPLLLIQGRQKVRQPSNRIRFPRTRGVLDEIVLSHTLRTDRILQTPDDVQLVVSREDLNVVFLGLDLLLLGVPLPVFLL